MTGGKFLVRIGWLALLVTVVLVVSAAYAWHWLHQPVVTQNAINYDVPRGASANLIAQDLQQAGWLAHPRIWAAWARAQGLSSKLRAGEYALTPGMTPIAMLQLFTSGKVILRSLTIIEGSTFANLRQVLARRDDIEQSLRDISDAELMQMLDMPETHPEGQFFPDTYQFAKHSSDLEILRMARLRMQSELSKAWQQRDDDLLIETPYEALILASIIEKETAKASERAQIAGVFMERLARNMMLQTDPTVIYGLGAGYDGNLRKSDLLRDGPYNSYTRAGLPPTPIAFPGAEALYAAVLPNRTGESFCVAWGRG
ncbi:MAG: endolytic transglycosylase MltG, partial [Steroidobacteraceae bacterium]